MQIRRARTDEADLLTALIMRSKQSNGYDDAFMEACREELRVTPERLEESEFWVVCDDALCGCACLTIDSASADTTSMSGAAKSAEVGSFFIESGCKRTGVGQMLWQHLRKRAEQLGITMLHLDSDPLAVPFYEKQGFAVVGQTPSGSVPGRNIPYMELLLA